MSLGDYEAVLTEIAEEWATAEHEIKLAEQIHKRVVFLQSRSFVTRGAA